MRHNITKIAIENPCDKKSWANMSPTQQGKFCNICSKNVIDFTTMTDLKIIEYLNKQDQNVCAKLNSSQINRVLKIKEPSQVKHWKTIAASLLIFTTITHAQAGIDIIQNRQQQAVENHSKLPAYKFQNSTQKDSTSYTITGKIIEGNGSNSINTEVFIEELNIKSTTDSLGNFHIQIPETIKLNQITIMVNAVGFEDDYRKVIKTTDLPILNLIIEREEFMLAEVVITRKKRWWQFWKW